MDDETAAARIREIMHRTGHTAASLAELIHVHPGKIEASLAGQRCWSTYELAAIAEVGGTTVEWITGDDEPTEAEIDAMMAEGTPVELVDRPE